MVNGLWNQFNANRPLIPGAVKKEISLGANSLPVPQHSWENSMALEQLRGQSWGQAPLQQGNSDCLHSDGLL